MFKFAVAGLACLAVATAVPTLSESQRMFDEFVTKFHKSYASVEEYNLRLQNFRDNLAVAETLNTQGSSVHGVTKFSDLSAAEFKSLYTGYKAGSVRAALGNVAVAQPRLGVPNAVDWRTKGVVTPVKNQGQCGSCWAFSTVEEIETDWIMAGNSMIELSPEQIVQCDTVDQGCNGGDTVTAYQYVEKAGLETEAAYPYTSGLSATAGSGSGSTPGSGSSGSGTCEYNAADVAVNITGFSYGTTNNDENTMMSSVASLGPMSVCLATGGWQTYSSGILTASTCGTSVDHCVQVVGYNTASSQKYWIVRNSWATDWGIEGYIYVQLGANACDIAGEVTYAHTAKP